MPLIKDRPSQCCQVASGQIIEAFDVPFKPNARQPFPAIPIHRQ